MAGLGAGMQMMMRHEGTSGWGRGGECACAKAFCRCRRHFPPSLHGLQPTLGGLRKLACPAIQHLRIKLFVKMDGYAGQARV
jgi:hypothetical protein